jgi:hypothetical protein
VARLGTFSLKAYPETWFNDLANVGGWLPQDVVPIVGVPVPPPPPPKPKPVITRARPSGGGSGSVGPTIPYCPPDWLARFLVPYDECDDLCPPEDEATTLIADYALLHVEPPAGAVVKALAAGTVETVLDSKGRQSIVLTAADGTRYWYADVGESLVTDGARVRVGQPIGRTKSGAAPLPMVTPAAPRAALPAGAQTEPPPPARPAQVVFVEPPLPEAAARVIDEPLRPLPQAATAAPAPRPAPARPVIALLVPAPPVVVRLVPIDQPKDATLRAPDHRQQSPLLRALAPIALAAAIFLALAAIDSKPPKKLPPRPRSRPHKKKKRR